MSGQSSRSAGGEPRKCHLCSRSKVLPEVPVAQLAELPSSNRWRSPRSSRAALLEPVAITQEQPSCPPRTGGDHPGAAELPSSNRWRSNQGQPSCPLRTGADPQERKQLDGPSPSDGRSASYRYRILTFGAPTRDHLLRAPLEVHHADGQIARGSRISSCDTKALRDVEEVVQLQ